MGDWRTVQIVGSMSADDAAMLKAALDRQGDLRWELFEEPFGCLTWDSVHPGLCGLGAWPQEKMNVGGNLAERGYDHNSVRDGMEMLVRLTPSMLLMVHCGGPYESEECIATVGVGEGLARLLPPRVKTVTGATEGQMLDRLAMNMRRPR